MTKTYTFYTKNANNGNTFFHNNKSADYSKILDDIITADLIKKNSYLFDTKPSILASSDLKIDDAFIKATNFLANYKKPKKATKYIIGKMYTLTDGTPITFFDDEIQIGFDTYKYSNFTDKLFLSNLPADTKKTIINIYINISL